MINKLDHNNTSCHDMIDKINEIIDFLNGTFLMKEKDTSDLKLINDFSISTTTTKLNGNIDAFSNNINVKCPHCGKSYYTELHSESTCVYYPPILKDGVNINLGRNKLTTHCKCLNCGEEFDV